MKKPRYHTSLAIALLLATNLILCENKHSNVVIIVADQRITQASGNDDAKLVNALKELEKRGLAKPVSAAIASSNKNPIDSKIKSLVQANGNKPIHSYLVDRKKLKDIL